MTRQKQKHSDFGRGNQAAPGSAVQLSWPTYPDLSHRVYCPLKDNHQTTVNSLGHDRISGLNLLLKVQIKQGWGGGLLRPVHCYLAQINTAVKGRKLLTAGKLKPVVKVLDWNRTNLIPNSSSKSKAMWGSTGLCSTIVHQFFVSVMEGSPAGGGHMGWLREVIFS